jgi:hypothetical protein
MIASDIEVHRVDVNEVWQAAVRVVPSSMPQNLVSKEVTGWCLRADRWWRTYFSFFT